MSLLIKPFRYKEASAGRSGATDKLANAVDEWFYHNPEGGAIFAARFVKAFAHRHHYTLQAFPGGANKNRCRATGNLIADTL